MVSTGPIEAEPVTGPLHCLSDGLISVFVNPILLAGGATQAGESEKVAQNGGKWINEAEMYSQKL